MTACNEQRNMTSLVMTDSNEQRNISDNGELHLVEESKPEVDSDILLVNEKQVNSYIVDTVEFSYNELIDIFFNDTSELEINDYEVNVNCTNSDEDLLCYSGSFSYRTQLSKDISKILNMKDYYLSPMNNDIYSTLIEAENFEKLPENILKEVEGIGEELGIKLIYPKSYYINKELLLELNSDMISKGYSDENFDENLIPDDFECHFVQFQVMIDTLPLAVEDYVSHKSDNYMSGVVVNVLIDDTGNIYSFEINGKIYEIKSVIENSDLISEEEISNIINEKYNSMIDVDKAYVNELYLAYVPIETESNGIKLVPAWNVIGEIQVIVNEQNETKTFKKVEFINAITGEEIV